MEIEEFWKDAYPEINTIAVKTDQMQKAGYIPLAAFILPENCWIENFYDPQEKVQKAFLEKYPGNKTAEELVSYQRQEARIYSRFKKYYGYAFYIGKKS